MQPPSSKAKLVNNMSKESPRKLEFLNQNQVSDNRFAVVPLPEISSKSKKVIKVYNMSHKGLKEERSGLPDQIRDESLGDRSYTPSFNLV